MEQDTSATDPCPELDARELAILAAAKLRHRVQTHPLSTLAGAFGVGYILGGGIPNIVLRMAATVAARAVSQQLASQVLGEGLTNVMGSTGINGRSSSGPKPGDFDVRP